MSSFTLSSLACNSGSPADFLAALPAVQRHAQIQFRNCNRGDAEEFTAEAVAAAYVSYLNLAGRGQLDQAYPSTLAGYAVRHVRRDRHVGGQTHPHALARVGRGRADRPPRG